jgi:hypothetical protein
MLASSGDRFKSGDLDLRPLAELDSKAGECPKYQRRLLHSVNKPSIIYANKSTYSQ